MESMSTLPDALQAFHDYYARQLHLQELAASHESKSESSSSSEDEEDEEEKNEDDEEKNEDEDDKEINGQCCPGCGATVPKRFDEEDESEEDDDKEKNEDEKDEDNDEEELGTFMEEINGQCCPGCGATVPKRFGGSIHMICWCQCEFCYRCGERWKESHFDTCEENSSD